MKKRALLLFSISLLLGILSHLAGLTFQQTLIVSIFSLSILGTLLFWDFRLSFVFIGSSILFLISGVNIGQFIRFASLDVIIFLIGMMIVVGMLKESGVFQQVVAFVLRARRINGLKLFVIIIIFSAILSALVGEVTSMIVVVAMIFSVCDSLKINPGPLVISTVLTTNIGSAATLLGNPIGILIALRSNLTFEDFLTHALPVSVVVLVIIALILCIWYRNYIKEISSKITQSKTSGDFLKYQGINAGTIVNMVLFGSMILSIALHKRLEMLLGFEENRLLVVLPVIFAGIAVIFRCEKVKYCIKNEVEWRSLLFFIFLFAQAGIIQSSGVAQFLAEKLVKNVGNHPTVLSGIVIFSSGILSGVLDNTVVVSSYIPIVKSLYLMHFSLKPLWWCVLFGACFGGNITAIGSTANIVALGLLEKEKNIKINPREWLKLGLVVSILSMLIAYFAIVYVPIFSK